jgi:hypothetical protein
MLCSLSISMWSARKHDPEASEEIAQRHGAQPDAGRYHSADRGEGASRELWQRLYEAVSHMAERLQVYKVTEEGVEHPFRDSVVTNLVKLVDVLPKLNVTGDPELERLAAQVRASLLVDPKLETL